MKKVFTLLLTVLMVCICLVPFSAVAEDESTINKFNVVFVIDSSTSMKYSDEKNNRFEATDLFLGMLANEGNYVGTVSFNGNVTSKDIKPVSGVSSKKEISKDIRQAKLAADTNIGGALLQATTLLEKNSNKELPSIIILLSDGNTDFDDPKQIQESKEQKETALEIAREKGYSICAVSLNNDGKADQRELKNIANATNGGMFEEVNKASDLKDVFDKFYTKIYGTKSSKLVDEKLGKNGKTTKKFAVTDVGVEEVNIAVFGDIKKCELVSSDGKKYSEQELNDITFSANSFKLLKLVNPQKGDYEITVTGKPGTKITVVKTYNVNMGVQTVVENESDSYKQNQAINISAKILEENELIDDIEKYDDFKGVMKVTNVDGDVVFETEDTEATENGFEFQFTPDSLNTFYVDISIEGSEVYAEAEQIVLNVGNTSPEAVNDVVKKHVNIWPFLIKTDSTVDLIECAKDNEDEELDYKVVSSTWEQEDYSLSEGKLTIDSFKNFSKGSFEIQAVDKQGAFCTFDVKVTSTNIGILAMILIGLAIIVAIIIIAIITKIMLGKAFMGEVNVSNLQTYQSFVPQKSRGRIKLSSLQIGDTGLDKNSYFQATGKEYIYFISKKPVSTDSLLNKSKKIKIENNFDTRIYADDEHTKGIEVRFNSFKNNILY